MSAGFEVDPFPGKPRILFIGWPESSHTHSWIDLLEGSEFNVRLFALPSSVPPATWRVKTYVTLGAVGQLESAIRAKAYPPFPLPFVPPAVSDLLWNTGAQQFRFMKRMTIERALARVIERWRPDIIHTLGFDAASFLYQRTREQYGLEGIGTWVAQARGGPDIALHRHLPEYREKIVKILQACDHLIADNQLNYDYAVALGLARSKLSPVGVVSGPGGVDTAALEKSWSATPSQRERMVLLPKTYEVKSSKALPVLEAIRLAWDRIKPCRFYLLWVVQPEITIWLQEMLSEEIRQSCVVMERIPRAQVLELMVQARVMLAPSLSDGIPNSMLEAMACGAFPVVSPLGTITPVVEDGQHVLFARNLYPQEIATALERAMTDDRLVDQAARKNLELVKKIANRDLVRSRVLAFYQDLCRRKP